MEKEYRVGIFKKSKEKIKDNEATIATYFSGSWKQLETVICEAAWTNLIFGDAAIDNDKLQSYQRKAGYRISDNFEGCDFLVLDIDDGLPIDEAHKKLKDYKHIIAPTKSHQQFKKGIKADRYRVLIDISEPITSAAEYKATWRKAQELVGNAGDISTKDLARFWNPCLAPKYISDGKAIKNIIPTEKEIETNTSWQVQGADIHPLLRKKIKNNITFEDSTKIRMRCILPGHEDKNPSAFINKQTNWYNCTSASCGKSMSCWALMDILGISRTNELHEQQANKYNEKAESVANWVDSHILSEDNIKNIVLRPVDWLVEGFINNKGVTVLAADSGVGKTWLLCDLMIACTHKTDWLDSFETKKRNVLYIAYEEDEQDLKRRMLMLMNGRGNIEKLDYKYYWLPVPPWGFDKVDFYQKIREVCAKFKIGAIFIDTLRQAASSADENSANEMGVIIHRMQVLADELDGLVIITHHTNKSEKGDYRGTTAIKGNTQGMLKMKADLNGYTLSVEKVKQGMAHEPITLYRKVEDEDKIVWSINSNPENDESKSLIDRIFHARAKLPTEFSKNDFIKYIHKGKDIVDDLINYKILIANNNKNRKGNDLYEFCSVAEIEERVISITSKDIKVEDTDEI